MEIITCNLLKSLLSNFKDFFIKLNIDFQNNYDLYYKLYNGDGDYDN